MEAKIKAEDAGGLSSLARAVPELSPDTRRCKKLFQSGLFTHEPKEALEREARRAVRHDRACRPCPEMIDND